MTLAVGGRFSNTFFSVPDQIEFTASLSKAACGKDTCDKATDLDKVPDMLFDLECDGSTDYIKKMTVKIAAKDYAYFDGTSVKFLIGANKNKDDETWYLDRLFFSKYELFIRTLGDDASKDEKERYVSFGFGDVSYKFEAGYWYIVTGLATLLIALTFIVPGILGGKENKGDVSDLPVTSSIGKETEDDSSRDQINQ